jgi:hypothetical protein
LWRNWNTDRIPSDYYGSGTAFGLGAAGSAVAHPALFNTYAKANPHSHADADLYAHAKTDAESQ